MGIIDNLTLENENSIEKKNLFLPYHYFLPSTRRNIGVKVSFFSPDRQCNNKTKTFLITR